VIYHAICTFPERRKLSRSHVTCIDFRYNLLPKRREISKEWVNNYCWGWQNRTVLANCTHLYDKTQGWIKHKCFRQRGFTWRRLSVNQKRLCLVVPCVSSYRWIVHFSRLSCSVLCQQRNMTNKRQFDNSRATVFQLKLRNALSIGRESCPSLQRVKFQSLP